MPNDYLPKKPTQNEKFLYELTLDHERLKSNFQLLFKAFMEINQRLIALARAKVTPDVLAQFVVDEEAGEAFMKIYSENLDSLLKEKMKKAADKIAPETNDQKGTEGTTELPHETDKGMQK